MFSLTFETDNDAFTGGNRKHELARILRDLAKRIVTEGASEGRIRDINGNTIGTFTIQK
jgi:hypothetical protein